MSQTHRVKLNTKFFDRVISGQKTFEIRKNDRDYQVGDRLSMYPHHEPKITFTYPGMERRNIEADITYMSTFEQKEGYVVLGIKVISVTSGEQS
jgi:hypothetical protein